MKPLTSDQASSSVFWLMLLCALPAQAYATEYGKIIYIIPMVLGGMLVMYALVVVAVWIGKTVLSVLISDDLGPVVYCALTWGSAALIAAVFFGRLTDFRDIRKDEIMILLLVFGTIALGFFADLTFRRWKMRLHKEREASALAELARQAADRQARDLAEGRPKKRWRRTWDEPLDK